MWLKSQAENDCLITAYMAHTAAKVIGLPPLPSLRSKIKSPLHALPPQQHRASHTQSVVTSLYCPLSPQPSNTGMQKAIRRVWHQCALASAY